MTFLRPATNEDARKLFEWKNDKIVRKFSIVTGKKIKWKAHLRWLKDNLKYILIITDGEHDMGDIRIKQGKIIIKLDKKYRGKGIGSEAVIKMSEPGIEADITDGNVASMRLFLGCGYKIIRHEVRNKIGYYVLRYEL